MLNVEQQFTDDFIEKFSQEGFYAAPNRTKIYISIGKGKKLVGNSIVANLEQVNEKIPVYSYNSSTYNKHLNGKQVVTGVIALRKITVAQFISMITLSKTDYKIQDEIKELTEELVKLENLFKSVSVANGLRKIIASKKLTLEKMKNLIKNRNLDSRLFEMENMNIELSDDLFDKDDLLYYLENSGGNEKAKIEINFEGSFGDVCPYIGLKDVLFTKKRTEINVNRGDIIEIYEFIGNPLFKINN